MTTSSAVTVVVPLKGGPLAKSRLDLPRETRLALAEAFARDTLAAVAAAGLRTVVVTGDPEVAVWAGERAVVASDPGGGLDAAVAAGLARVRADRGTRAAVLLGDHPALRADELLAALGVAAGSGVLPDADGTGTALLVVGLGPGPLPRTAFGADSAAAHVALGHPRVDLDVPGLRTDVDDAASLRAAVALGVGPATRSALRAASLRGVQATIHRAPGPDGGSALLDDGTEVAVPAESLADSGLLHLRVGQRVSVELAGDGRTATRVWIAGIGAGETIG